jgi:predicted porin
MKRYFSLAAGATLLLGTAMGMAHPAFAQDQSNTTTTTTPATTTGAASGPFADVPADHWAYQAVNTLQRAGIVIGYPDGTYGGRRAMTRYEFAVAIARLLPMIQQPIDTSQFVKNGDFQAFQNDVNGRLQQQQQALDALRALVNEFQPELQRLGQDVAAIQRRLDADEERLAAVEAEQRRVKITGEANFIARSNINTSDSDNDPLDKDGYRIGMKGNKSLWNDINVYHDILLDIDGRVTDTAHVIIKIDAGNYLDSIGSYESLDPFNLHGQATAGADSFSIYQAYLDAPVSLGPLAGAEAVVGRFGEQFTPFTLKAIDPDSYTYLPETDSGDVTVDGAKLAFGVGGAHVQIYGGKNAPIDNAVLTGGPSYFANNGRFRPGSIYPGGEQYDNFIDQSAGARVTFGNPDAFTIGVTGLIARVNPSVILTSGISGFVPGFPSTFTGPFDPYNAKPYNNLAVYGVDFQGTVPFVKKSGLTLDGEFANSATGFDSRFGNVNSTKGTEAWYAELGYTFGPFNIKGGYKEVYNNFAAPGFWGKIGEYTNPTNIRGPIVHASFAITPTLSLVGDGNFFKGIYNLGDQNPLGKDDDLTSFDVGLKYGLTSAYNVDLGYEWVQWNLKNNQGLLLASGKPTEQYITIGLGHNLSRNSSLKLLYQIIDYKDKGTGFDPLGDSHGGVAVTQFSVKF